MKRKIKRGIKILSDLIESSTTFDDENKLMLYTYRAYGLMTQHKFKVFEFGIQNLTI
jgi:hypothetical protein